MKNLSVSVTIYTDGMDFSWRDENSYGQVETDFTLTIICCNGLCDTDCKTVVNKGIEVLKDFLKENGGVLPLNI